MSKNDDLVRRHPLTPKQLRALLRYDSETGRLFWRERNVEWFRQGGAEHPGRTCATWNARYANKEAMRNRDKFGYFKGRVDNRSYKAHRVIWALVYGRWPTMVIDHINGDTSDNRLSNLREADFTQNSINALTSREKAGGLRGTFRQKGCKRWGAAIKAYGKRHNLGTFKTAEAAHAAYRAAAVRLHGDFVRVESERKAQ